MKELGEIDLNLRAKAKRSEFSFSLNHDHQVEKILEKFNYFDVDPLKTPYDSNKNLKKNK